MKIRVTKDFDFEMAHALDFHEGKCKYLHGHSYKLSVTVLGKPKTEEKQSDTGMVIDFTSIKEIVRKNILDLYDHSLVLQKHSPYMVSAENWPNKTRLHLKDYQPTCENLLIEFIEILASKFPSNASLIHVKLQETSTSYAEWHASDN